MKTRNQLLPFEIAETPSVAAIARLCFPVAFILVDSGALVLAATAAHWLPGSGDESGWQGYLPGTSFMYPLVFWGISLSAFYVFGFYDRLRMTLRNSELGDLYAALTVGIVVTMAVSLLLASETSPAVYIATWLAAPPAVFVARGLLRRVRRQVCPTSTRSIPLLLLGRSEEMKRLDERIEAVPELDLLPIKAGSNGAMNTLQEVREFVQEYGIRYVIIAASETDQDFVAETADYCHETGLRVAWLQRTTDLPMAVSSLHTWDGTPVIHLSEPIAQRAYEAGKRVLDLTCALAALPLLLPLFLSLSLAVKLDSTGPAIMKQRRVGRGSRTFDMFKFRSMRTVNEEIPDYLRARNEATGPMFKLRSDPRLTRVGRFLRRSSLDEIPQIFNVLRGQMSLVGPRPPLPREIPGYDALQRKRLMVKPGITGLWQVSGRSRLTFEEMLRLDVRYIQKRSLFLDIIILLKTVPCVLSGKGAY